MRVRIGQRLFQEEQMALYPRLLGPFLERGEPHRAGGVTACGLR